MKRETKTNRFTMRLTSRDLKRIDELAARLNVKRSAAVRYAVNLLAERLGKSQTETVRVLVRERLKRMQRAKTN